MKRVRIRPLYKFLEESSKYFTSLAFFGVLLTIALFINFGDNSQINLTILIFQSGSLLMLILCLLPLIIKLRESDAIILQIFYLLLTLTAGGLIVYLWYQYTGVVSGLIFLALIILGFFHIESFKEHLVRKNWKSTLLFIFVVSYNFYLIFKGDWNSQFIEVKEFSNIIPNGIAYLFVGYCFWLFLSVISFLLCQFKKENLFKIKK